MKLAVVLQVLGLVVLVSACTAAWGPVAGMFAAGVALVALGVIRELEVR